MNNEKIAEVVKQMLSKPELIQNVSTSNEFESGEEFYFTYPEHKYTWSVARDSDGEYFVFYYPSAGDHTTFLRFPAKEIKPDGSMVRELFTLIEGKRFGFDEVLKDILN